MNSGSSYNTFQCMMGRLVSFLLKEVAIAVDIATNKDI